MEKLKEGLGGLLQGIGPIVTGALGGLIPAILVLSLALVLQQGTGCSAAGCPEGCFLASSLQPGLLYRLPSLSVLSAISGPSSLLTKLGGEVSVALNNHRAGMNRSAEFQPT